MATVQSTHRLDSESTCLASKRTLARISWSSLLLGSWSLSTSFLGATSTLLACLDPDEVYLPISIQDSLSQTPLCRRASQPGHKYVSALTYIIPNRTDLRFLEDHILINPLPHKLTPVYTRKRLVISLILSICSATGTIYTDLAYQDRLGLSTRSTVDKLVQYITRHLPIM